MLSRIDPMVRLILAAMLVASVLPVRGSAHAMVQALSNVMIFVLFLLYGLKLKRSDVLAGIGNLRLLVPLFGFVFGFMALAGWLAWQFSADWLPPALALGFLYWGVLPSTVQSATVYTSLAGGNVASSVVSAALLNIAGVFISLPLFALLAGGGEGSIHGGSLVKVLVMILLPFVIGQASQRYGGAWVKGNRRAVTFLERGTIGLAVYTSYSGAVVEGVWSKVAPAAWGGVASICAVLLLIGYGGAFLLGRWLKLPHGDRVAMVFGGAQKSIAMGAPMAAVVFRPQVAGLILLPLLVYHLAQMMVAAWVAGRLRDAVE